MSLVAGLRNLGANMRASGGLLGLRARMAPLVAPPPASIFVRWMKVRSAIKKRCEAMSKQAEIRQPEDLLWLRRPWESLSSYRCLVRILRQGSQ